MPQSLQVINSSGHGDHRGAHGAGRKDVGGRIANEAHAGILPQMPPDFVDAMLEDIDAGLVPR